MKYVLYFITTFSCSLASAQKLNTEKNIVYGKATDFKGRVLDLRFDITYSPKESKLPLIVFTHGGEFSESSSKEEFLPFCNRLAEKGFVVANVEYRRGLIPSFHNYKTELTKAVYRAEQDLLAAVRYLVFNADRYRIDTSLVLVSGESAGAVVALFTAYVSQHDWKLFMPTLEAALGDLNSSGNDLPNKFSIKGIIGMWGGIVDTSFISAEEMRLQPALLFHSINDDIIPFEQASQPKAKYTLLQGSKDIAARLKNNNGCYQLYYVREAGHSYGFSGDFIVNSISKFVTSLRDGKCSSLEAENRERNITLSMFDSDDAAFPDEDDKIVKLKPELLHKYVGKYQLGKDAVSTVAVEGNHLNAQSPDGEISELYPLGKNVFIQKKFNLRVEFTTDSLGNITGQKVRLNKYKEYYFKKVE